jgi:hypothetical protein
MVTYWGYSAAVRHLMLLAELGSFEIYRQSGKTGRGLRRNSREGRVAEPGRTPRFFIPFRVGDDIDAYFHAVRPHITYHPALVWRIILPSPKAKALRVRGDKPAKRTKILYPSSPGYAGSQSQAIRMHGEGRTWHCKALETRNHDGAKKTLR